MIHNITPKSLVTLDFLGESDAKLKLVNLSSDKLSPAQKQSFNIKPQQLQESTTDRGTLSNGALVIDYRNSLIDRNQMLAVPSGDFENDKVLNPMRLPQDVIDACMQYKTEITSRVVGMDQMIKSYCEREDKLYRGQINADDLQVIGPMNPNCVIAEDDFSPVTDQTLCQSNERKAEESHQELIAAQKEQQIKSDFTSQSNSMIEKMAEREIGRRISQMSGLNPAPKMLDLIIEQQNKEQKSDNSPSWSIDKKEKVLQLGHSPKQLKDIRKSPHKSGEPKKAFPMQMQKVQSTKPSMSLKLQMLQLYEDKNAAVHPVTRVPSMDEDPISHKQIEHQAMSATSNIQKFPMIMAPGGARDSIETADFGCAANGQKLDHHPVIKQATDSGFSVSTAPLLQCVQEASSVQPSFTSYLPATKPARKKGKKTLVLDLDETLVHSSFKPVKNPDFTFTINISNIPNQVMSQKVYACKRPYCDQFLEVVAANFEIVMFTASLQRYAEPLFKKLDPKERIFNSCLYREHCTHYKREFYVKDLTRLGRPIQDIIILDNSPNSYQFQPQNALPCSSWFDNENDNELLQLIPIMEKLAKCNGDIRRILRKITPKPPQTKMVVSRANLILEKALRRQQNQDGRQAQMVPFSQDSANNLLSVSRSTSSPALIDSQTFASAKSFAKLHKSAKGLKEVNQLHNLLSGRSKENNAEAAGPLAGGAGSTRTVELSHISKKLGNVQGSSRNHSNGGTQFKSIQNFQSVNYRSPKMTVESTGGALGGGKTLPSISPKLTNSTATNQYRKMISQMRLQEQHNGAKQSRNTATEQSSRTVDERGLWRSLKKDAPSMDQELLEGTRSIEEALQGLKEIENPTENASQTKQFQNQTPPLKPPVPLAPGQLKKIEGGGLLFPEMSKAESTRVEGYTSLTKNQIQQLVHSNDRWRSTADDKKSILTSSITTPPLMTSKNILPKPNHLQKLLAKFEKRKKQDSKALPSNEQPLQDKSSSRIQGANSQIPPILISGVGAAKMEKSATVKTLIPKLKLQALYPVQIDAVKPPKVRTKQQILNTELPSSLLLALQGSQNLATDRNFLRPVMAPVGTLAQMTSFDIPQQQAHALERTSQINTHFDTQQNLSFFNRQQYVQKKIDQDGCLGKTFSARTLQSSGSLLASRQDIVVEDGITEADMITKIAQHHLLSRRCSKGEAEQKINKFTTRTRSLPNTLKPLELQLHSQTQPQIGPFPKTLSQRVLVGAHATGAVHPMQIASPTSTCTAKVGKAAERNRILTLKRFRLQNALKSQLQSQQFDPQQAAEQVEAKKDGILMVKQSILSNHSDESEITKGHLRSNYPENNNRQTFIDKVIKGHVGGNSSVGGIMVPPQGKTETQGGSIQLSPQGTVQKRQVVMDNQSTKTLGRHSKSNTKQQMAPHTVKSSCKQKKEVSRFHCSPEISSPFVDICSFSDSILQPEPIQMEHKLLDNSQSFKMNLRSIHEEASSLVQELTPNEWKRASNDWFHGQRTCTLHHSHEPHLGSSNSGLLSWNKALDLQRIAAQNWRQEDEDVRGDWTAGQLASFSQVSDPTILMQTGYGLQARLSD